MTPIAAFETGVLSVNPWEMDDSDYRVLDNRMVTTRVAHDCAICFEVIGVGARARAQREVFDGKAKTFYFCGRCCQAMADLSSGIDANGSRLADRYELGRRLAPRPIEAPHDHELHQWEGEGGR